MWNRTAAVVALILASLVPTTDGIACAAGVSTYTVQDTAGAESLRAGLNCTGGEFLVSWEGNVTLANTLVVYGGTSLTAVGLGESLSLIDGGNKVRLFLVADGTLHLKNLSLERGNATHGGAIYAYGDSAVSLTDCLLQDCRAYNLSGRGGAVAVHDEVSLDLDGTTFAGNLAGPLYNFNADYSADYQEVEVYGLGGAISSYSSSPITLQGENIFEGNAALRAGAIWLYLGTLNMTDGSKTTFNANHGGYGGAIDMYGGTANLTGTSSFLNNSASFSGGAIFIAQPGAEDLAAELYLAGNTTFRGNNARQGGCFYNYGAARVDLTGRTIFAENEAYFDVWGGFGGAIAGNLISTPSSYTEFRDNVALYGGAFHVGGVTLGGVANFVGNHAGQDGGALFVPDGVFLAVGGDTTFSENTADGLGGAIYAASAANISIENAVFRNNRAVGGSGGGLHILECKVVEIVNTLFESNSAPYGGGVASFSSGVGVATYCEAGPGVGGNCGELEEGNSLTYRGCTFKENTATEDGGGIYTSNGYDQLSGCSFARNRAGGSGGAIFHAGTVEYLIISGFEENLSGVNGPAIMSVGALRNITELEFSGNAYYCSDDTYLSEVDAEDSSCRLETVCYTCSTPCDSPGFTIEKATKVPVCEVVPEHTTSDPGSTAADLELEAGYYRISSTSTNILECHRSSSCEGGFWGETQDDQCAPGYVGPYCAVCDDHYSSGSGYTCRNCQGASKRKAQTLGIIAVIALAGFVGFVVFYLVEDEKGRKTSFVNRRIAPNLRRLADLFKIVLVVWQIITQFVLVTGIEYPGAYRDFLAGIDMFSLDFGHILSFTCFVDTTFYDRLLLSTIGPLVLLAGLVGTYYVAICRNSGSADSSAAVAAIRQKHTSIALFLSFVVYAPVSSTIFSTFVCDDDLDPGRASYLKVDYSLTCTGGRHQGYKIFAGFMVAVYPIGIPALYLYWLVRNKNLLRTHKLDAPFSDLWRAYRPEVYFYEVVECLRRVSLTGTAVFLPSDGAAQIGVTLWLAFVMGVVTEILSPYRRSLDMWAYRVGYVVVFMSMYFGLLLKVDVSTEGIYGQDVFSSLLVFAHCVLIFAVVMEAFVLLRGAFDYAGLGKSKVEEKTEPMPSTRRESSTCLAIDLGEDHY